MASWEDVHAEVLRRIRARDWAPGELIPGEEDLALEFGVARATVNRALRTLAEAGLIERRRKAGTRVAALPVRRATLRIPVIRQEVEGRGQRYAFRLLRREAEGAPAPVASRLEIEEGTPLLRLETLHLADGLPFVFEERWLNPLVLPLPMPDFHEVSANEWLVANVPFLRGDIAFSATAAHAREAEALDVAPGTALFVTERTTFTTGAPVTLVRMVHAPGYRLLAPL